MDYKQMKIEFGKGLARFAEQALARHPEIKERCKTCAFREGTQANLNPQTGLKVLKCLAEKEKFYCHHGIKNGEPTKLCAGYKALSLESSDEAIKAPWEYEL